MRNILDKMLTPTNKSGVFQIITWLSLSIGLITTPV